METLDQQIRKKAIDSGILLGAISIVLSIFSFYLVTSIGKSFFVVVFGPVVIVILSLAIMVVFAAQLRKKIGGFWTFRQATTGIAVMLFVSALLNVIVYNLAFGKLIEPKMIDKMETAMVGATTQMMEKSNADQDKIDKQNEAVQKQFEDQKNPTIGKIITGYAIQIILIFVFALILGAIFKRPPLLKVEDAVDPFTATPVS
jgi:cytochrome c biogenesis factor